MTTTIHTNMVDGGNAGSLHVEAAVARLVDKVLMVRGNVARMKLVEASIAAAERAGVGVLFVVLLTDELHALGMA